ncbi:MAG: cupin domain-containing protein [Candidatus Sumerlaeaceae bacterium]
MPIIRGDKLRNFPEAAKIAGYGVARYKARTNNPVEAHFHDGEELWMMVEGRIRGKLDGAEFELGPNEVLLTMPGQEHELVEVLEDSTIVWLEQNLQGRKRQGHLHRGIDEWP